MHQRTKIKLNASDRAELEAVVANWNSPQKHVWRAKIVLLIGHGTSEIMQRTGKAKTVIWRWQERFGVKGVMGLWRDKTRPSRIPPLDPKIAERVVALTLAGPPSHATHWTGAAMAKAIGISGYPCHCRQLRRAQASQGPGMACAPLAFRFPLHSDFDLLAQRS